MSGGAGTGGNEPHVWAFVCTKRDADASVGDPAPDIEGADYVALQDVQNGLQGSQNRLRQCPEPGYELRLMRSPASVHQWQAADLGGKIDGLGTNFGSHYDDNWGVIISFFVVGLVGAAVLRFLRERWRL